MIFAYYETLFLLSVLFLVIYVFVWQKRFDVNITAIFILIPFACLSYLLLIQAKTLESALIALKLIYVGGCFLPWLIAMCVLNLCGIRISRFLRMVSFAMNILMYACVMTIGYSPYFYKSVEMNSGADGPVFQKVYGPLHTVFYLTIGIYFLVSFAAIFYSFCRKKQVSRRILNLLVLPQVFAVIGYFANHLLGSRIEIMPATYVFAQFVYLLIIRRIAIYNVSDMVIESMVQSGDIGFITLDFHDHYLGSNETAKRILPVLNNVSVDHSIKVEPELQELVDQWIEHFTEYGNTVQNFYNVPGKEDAKEGRTYEVNVNYLYDGVKRRGYQIFLQDDTTDQNYIQLLDQYNFRLQERVEEKTKRIVDMHDNLILSMAAMVESRDNSTGGHIRRTSEGVRLLIDEIKKTNSHELSDKFCKDLIKAAPMHDLGKIAVDDAVLRKPGKFTDEEFEKMKKHAAEGARIVHEILKGTDDKEFHKVAENVAHYHHERWDGSGYPEGLRGEKIPLEARIMAIADVYDALVSKRVYKDSMSFEQADRIIMEGMGKHFDPGLREIYMQARPKLEEYYSSPEGGNL